MVSAKNDIRPAALCCRGVPNRTPARLSGPGKHFQRPQLSRRRPQFFPTAAENPAQETEKAGVIMEFKAAADEEEMEAKAKEALMQIETRRYDTEFQKRGIKTVWKYGIAFCGKKVVVRSS